MIENLIERMILEGKISQETVDRMIEEEREKSPLLSLSKKQEAIKQDQAVLEEMNFMTMEALVESYETQQVQTEERVDENLDTMVALTEAYEMIIMMQETIFLLEDRLANLEGGA